MINSKKNRNIKVLSDRNGSLKCLVYSFFLAVNNKKQLVLAIATQYKFYSYEVDCYSESVFR